MFSRMSAKRFDEPEATGVGPGSYEIPTTLDEHAAFINPDVDRFDDLETKSVGAFSVYEDEAANLPSRPSSVKRQRGRSLGGPKDKRPLQNLSNVVHSSKGAAAAQKPAAPPDLEQQLRRQLAEEQKLRTQDAAVAKKAAASTRSQLQAKDRQLEELQKKVDELTSSHREAQRRIGDLDTERGARKKALHDKEQMVLNLQKSISSLRAQLCERDANRPPLADQESQTAGEVQAEAIATEVSSRVIALEERLATQSREANEQLKSLAKAHNRVTLKARERLAQASDREADLYAKLTVREATVVALVALHEQQRAAHEDSIAQNEVAISAKLEVERRLIELQDLLATTQGASATATSAAEAANSAKLEVEEQVVELQARLAAAEQAEASANAAAAAAAEAVVSARLESQRQLAEVEARVVAAEASAAAATADVESTSSAKLEAEQQIAELKGRLFTAEQACELGVACQKQLEAQLEASRQADEARIAELQRRLSQEVEASDAAGLRAQRAEEDTAKLEGECESLRLQSRELLATIEAFRHDLELAKSELRSAHEAEALLLGELDSSKERQAKMAGHANHRQKIQYTINIKNENVSLRGELKKAKQRIAQLEVGRLNDAGGRAPRRTDSSGSDENSTPDSRSRRMAERELEMVKVDYQHLRSLVDRAALARGGGARDKEALEWLRQAGSGDSDSIEQKLEEEPAESDETPAEDVAEEEDTSAPAAGASNEDASAKFDLGADGEGEAEA